MYRKWGLVRCRQVNLLGVSPQPRLSPRLGISRKSSSQGQGDWGVGVDTRELALLLRWQDILLQGTCTMPLIGQEIPGEWAEDCERNR